MTGKEFENQLGENFAKLSGWEMEKVTPPWRIAGRSGSRATVYPAPNPFLDFIGTTPEGRMAQIEAKYTSDPGQRLSICKNNGSGLKEKQVESLRRWHDAGAFVGVIWGQEGMEYDLFITIEEVERAIAAREKSFHWGNRDMISLGVGLECLPDLI